MAIIRWQPWQEMETIRRQMDRLFEEMTGLEQRETVQWKPAIELKDDENHILVRAAIPGVDAKNLDVRVTRDTVVIAGEKQAETKREEGGYFHSEFRYGKFQRVIPLPVAVQNDQVKADFTNGILTLTLPKVVEAQNKVVKVNLLDNFSTENAAIKPEETAEAN